MAAVPGKGTETDGEASNSNQGQQQQLRTAAAADAKAAAVAMGHEMCKESIDPETNLPIVTITLTDKNVIKICKVTAQLISWISNGKERLFWSDKAVFERDTTPLRGGVSICWPSFGEKNEEAVGKHGFLLASDRWTLKRMGIVHPEDPSFDDFKFYWGGAIHSSAAIIRYPCLEAVFTHSPCSFEVNPEDGKILKILNKDEGNIKISAHFVFCKNIVKQELTVKNDSDKKLAFTNVWRTYLRTNPVTVREVHNVGGTAYEEFGEFFSPRGKSIPLHIDGKQEVDRIYSDIPLHLAHQFIQENDYSKDPTMKHSYCVVEITRSPNQPDLAVWNIGNEKKLPDLDDDASFNYICMEVGSINAVAVVEPKTEWKCWQRIEIKA